jgi:hypothetical protein
VKEVTSVMWVVEFGYGSGLCLSRSRRPTMPLMLLHPSMAEGQMVKRVDGKGVMSAVSKAMYVSRDAAGRLAERTLSSSQCGVSAHRHRCY